MAFGFDTVSIASIGSQRAIDTVPYILMILLLGASLQLDIVLVWLIEESESAAGISRKESMCEQFRIIDSRFLL